MFRYLSDDLRDGCGEFLGVGDMQKLVGTMRIGLRSEHATHHHLRLGKACAEQLHQRNRSTLTNEPNWSVKVRHAGVIQCLLKPRGGAGRIPSTGGAFGVESDLGLIGGVIFEQFFKLGNSGRGIDERGQSQAKLKSGIGTQYIARVFERRKTFCTRDTQGRFPSPSNQGLYRIKRGRQATRLEPPQS